MTRRPEAGRHKRPSRWTATAVNALPARSSPYTDPSTPGLQIFVRARRDGTVRRSWLLHFKWRGEESRIAIGHPPEMPLDGARAEVRRLRELAAQGIDPRRARPRRLDRPAPLPLSSAAARPDDQHSVDFLCSEFTTRFLRPARKRPEYAEAILAKNVLSKWRGRDARTIKPREVIELLDSVADRAPVMANRVAALLGQLFKFGIHRTIVETTPVQLLFRPGGREKPRQRTLSDDELQAFLKDPKDATRFERLSHVITLLLLTGQRRGELALARWRDIDLTAKTWTIPDANAKTGRGHILPLTDWAIEEFRALKAEAEGSPWVLPAKGGGRTPLNPKLLTRGIAKCQKRFKERGIKDFTLHDLRRTCRTGLARLKVEPHIAERVLNHVQPGIAGVYDRHAYLDEKRTALERWANHLKSLVG
jgi:integrase